MKWFAIDCIYQIICGEGKHSPQINEQVRLVQAKNAVEALQKVKQQAGNYNASFKNCEGGEVKWSFIDVGAITEIDKPADGVEVSSKILEPKSIEAYLENLKHRNKILTELNS